MDNLLSLAIPLIFVISGVVLLRVPARSLLKWDRRTGYWIYKRHLRLSGNEEEAIRKAGNFYKFFAVSLIVISVAFMVIDLVAKS